jgi:hypothetical protein
MKDCNQGEGKCPTGEKKRIENAVKKKILNITENVSSGAVSHSRDAEMLKEIFQDSVTSESLRVTILTVLPESWSIWKVQEVLPNASDCL